MNKIKTKVTIDELIQKTHELNAQFPHQMDRRDLMIDLMEEVGELAQAMLIIDGRKKTNNPTKQKTKADVADALCDVFYNLIMLAKNYDVDLPDEYQAMLTRLKTRVEGGEFNSK